MSIILINATAAKTSGALTVLKDCIAQIEQYPMFGKEYHLFTVVDIFHDLKNVYVHKLNVQNWLSRILWDNGGLYRWCQKNNLEPDAIISLQNTSTKYKNKSGLMITQVVYYHQAIPLYMYNGLGINFKLILYRHFYSFFVNRNNGQTHYVVQLSYIKELFCRKFKNIPSNRVTVIRTNRPQIDANAITEKDISIRQEIFRFLYPAASFNYKNHEVLISALAILKKGHPKILERINILFTVDKLSNCLMGDIALNNLDSCIQFIGQVSYTEMLSYYKSADAMLFPSKMESLGYPLLEASCFGLPIIACDLPYAREVLEGYTNKYFVEVNNPNAWANVIYNYKEYSKAMVDNMAVSENSWENFFELVDRLILEQRT